MLLAFATISTSVFSASLPAPVPTGGDPNPTAVKAAIAEFNSLSKKEKKERVKAVKAVIKKHQADKKSGQGTFHQHHPPGDPGAAAAATCRLFTRRRDQHPVLDQPGIDPSVLCSRCYLCIDRCAGRYTRLISFHDIYPQLRWGFFFCLFEPGAILIRQTGNPSINETNIRVSESLCGTCPSTEVFHCNGFHRGAHLLQLPVRVEPPHQCTAAGASLLRVDDGIPACIHRGVPAFFKAKCSIPEPPLSFHPGGRCPHFF